MTTSVPGSPLVVEIKPPPPEKPQTEISPPVKPKRKSRFEPETAAVKPDTKQRIDGKWDMFAEADNFGGHSDVRNRFLFSFKIYIFETVKVFFTLIAH